MAQATFGTAINCIDGRVQIPVITWMREVLSLDYVDLITQPGADGLLANDAPIAEQLIRPRVEPRAAMWELSRKGAASPTRAAPAARMPLRRWRNRRPLLDRAPRRAAALKPIWQDLGHVHVDISVVYPVPT